MTWLLPIGFLGLCGLIALIVIYVIKPNYQTKFVSSTYVWKLSMKYKRNKIPISKLNNILLFLCQFLILTVCGLLLAQPVLADEKTGDEGEKVLIIDASAGMLVTNGIDTRFGRAIDEVKLMADSTVAGGDKVSVILAGAEPYFVAHRIGEEGISELHSALDSLTEGDAWVSYTSADMDAAAALAEDVLGFNPEAKVYLYTGTKYARSDGFNIIDVSDMSVEWNAAILNCTARMNDNNHYEISVDTGCYGRTEHITVYCEVHGANGKPGNTVLVSKGEFFDPSEEEKTVTFTTDDFSGVPLYSFDYLSIYVSVSDMFDEDNAYVLYGGKVPTIRIQYASSLPNLYFSGMIRTIRESTRGTFNIEFKELKSTDEPATEGFDLYIFEHVMPKLLPSDGVVLIVDPDKAPEGLGIEVGPAIPIDSDSTLAAGKASPLMQYVESSRITIAKYKTITPAPNSGFEELAYYNGVPMILAKNEPDQKIVVWGFDLNHSNLIALPDFAFLMYNLFNHYIPTTMPSHSFEIGDEVTFRSRGTELKISGGGEEIEFEGSEGTLVISRPGIYTVTQKSMRGDELIIENFFVRIPNFESNITKEVDELPFINTEAKVDIVYEDLLFYFAIALVSLLFVEWYLHSRKNKL